MRKINLAVFLFIVSPMAWSMEFPLALDTLQKGRVANKAVLHKSIPGAEPIELIYTAEPQCHLFGHVHRKGKPGSPVIASLQFLACKNETDFTIWNIKGNINQQGISYTDAPGYYIIKPETPVKFTVTEFRNRRQGFEIILVNPRSSNKAIKISLGHLLSYQGQGEETLLPEFLQTP